MEKLLIHLYIPAVQKNFDLFLPQEIPIEQIVQALSKGVQELSRERYAISGQEMLLQEGAIAPLSPKETLYQYGVRDGDKLLLI